MRGSFARPTTEIEREERGNEAVLNSKLGLDLPPTQKRAGVHPFPSENQLRRVQLDHVCPIGGEISSPSTSRSHPPSKETSDALVGRAAAKTPNLPTRHHLPHTTLHALLITGAHL